MGGNIYVRPVIYQFFKTLFLQSKSWGKFLFAAEVLRDYPQGINVDRKLERARRQYKLSMTEGRRGGRS